MLFQLSYIKIWDHIPIIILWDHISSYPKIDYQIPTGCHFPKAHAGEVSYRTEDLRTLRARGRRFRWACGELAGEHAGHGGRHGAREIVDLFWIDLLRNWEWRIHIKCFFPFNCLICENPGRELRVNYSYGSDAIWGLDQQLLWLFQIVFHWQRSVVASFGWSWRDLDNRHVEKRWKPTLLTPCCWLQWCVHRIFIGFSPFFWCFRVSRNQRIQSPRSSQLVRHATRAGQFPRRRWSH